MKFKAILIGILSIVIAIISIQNAEVVDLKFFTYTFAVSRILLILISFFIGMAIGFLISIGKSGKKPQAISKN